MRTVLLLLVVGLLIAWYFYRQGLDKPEERQDRRISRSPKDSSKYHAVSIKPGAYACSAANEIAGQRFLASEAPTIPLPGCHASECDCGPARIAAARSLRGGWPRQPGRLPENGAKARIAATSPTTTSEASAPYQ
jgi:hypothetical protein